MLRKTCCLITVDRCEDKKSCPKVCLATPLPFPMTIPENAMDLALPEALPVYEEDDGMKKMKSSNHKKSIGIRESAMYKNKLNTTLN